MERIFNDLLRFCQPEKLSVYARYTRRGGLTLTRGAVIAILSHRPQDWFGNKFFSILRAGFTQKVVKGHQAGLL